MKRKFINLLNLVFICITALSITSCDNFLNGNEIAGQIKESIDYANAPSYLIKVSYQEGSGSVIKPASGETYQKKNDSFEIKFEASTEYQFIYWKASSSKLNSSQDINDYIQFEDPYKSETSVKFKKELDNIIITPVVMARPKALSCTPFSTGTLFLQDSKIQVIFNRNMDPSSIYYSVNEINTLMKEKKLARTDFLPENATIPENTTDDITEIYGYKTTDEDGEEIYIYKNILITDNEAQKNINSCFTAPYFKSLTTLVIPANTSNLPPAFSQIAVVLDKNFCYSTTIDGKDEKVSMGQIKDWIYQVNDTVDSSYPTISKCNVKYYASSGATATELSASTSSSVPVLTNLTYLKEKKLNIDIMAADVGSGLESYFELEFTKLKDKYYHDTTDPSANTKIIKASYKVQNSSYSSFTDDVDISSLDDGVYRLTINVVDRNNNTTTYSSADSVQYYYGAVDNGLYIEESDIVIADDQSSDYGLTFSWPDISDITKLTVKYKIGANASYNDLFEIQYPVSITSITKTTPLLPATSYFFKIHAEDGAGHVLEFDTESYTRPNAPVFCSYSSYLNVHTGITNLQLFFRKSGTETSGRLLISKSDNSQTSKYYTFDFGDETTTSTLVPFKTITDIESIGTSSGPYLIVQGIYRDKYGPSKVYLIRKSPLGDTLVIYPQP